MKRRPLQRTAGLRAIRRRTWEFSGLKSGPPAGWMASASRHGIPGLCTAFENPAGPVQNAKRRRPGPPPGSTSVGRGGQPGSRSPEGLNTGQTSTSASSQSLWQQSAGRATMRGEGKRAAEADPVAPGSAAFRACSRKQWRGSACRAIRNTARGTNDCARHRNCILCGL